MSTEILIKRTKVLQILTMIAFCNNYRFGLLFYDNVKLITMYSVLIMVMIVMMMRRRGRTNGMRRRRMKLKRMRI